MARGKRKIRTASKYSPHLSGWDPLDGHFASLFLESPADGLDVRDAGLQPEPQPTGTSPELLEWLRQLRENSREERLQQQWTPRPELGWCAFCPQPRHREANCAYTGPGFCCCCVFPEEEGELGVLHDAAGVEPSWAGSSDGFPPAPPCFVAPYAGLGGDRAGLRSVPGPLPDSAPPPLCGSSADGPESRRGEYGMNGSGVAPEEELAEDRLLGSDDDWLEPGGDQEDRQDPQSPAPAPRLAQGDGPEPEATGPGHGTARDSAPAGVDLTLAVSPGSTRDGGPGVPPAAAPTAAMDSGPTPTGGPPDSPGASPAAASPSVPECGPGSPAPAAPTAAEKSGPDFFAGMAAAGPGDSCPGPLPAPDPQAKALAPRGLATPPAGPTRPHRPSRRTAAIPPLAPRTSGPRAVAERGRLDVSRSPSLERGGRKEELSPPLSARCLSSVAPVTRNRLTFDPGGWKLRGRECGVRSRGSHG